MKTLTVGEFKAKFSEVLAALQKGEKFVVSYGKKKKKVAVLTAYLKQENNKPRRLGLLEGKASVRFMKDFKMTEEEFLNS